MTAKPVVDGFDKQLAGRVRFVRADINSPNGKKIAARVGFDMVPTLIGYDGEGVERWRMDRVPNRVELWRRLISL
jgi:hypothetical protein